MIIVQLAWPPEIFHNMATDELIIPIEKKTLDCSCSDLKNSRLLFRECAFSAFIFRFSFVIFLPLVIEVYKCENELKSPPQFLIGKCENSFQIPIIN